MNLLDDEDFAKKPEVKGKKLVLTLLIISVVLLILIIGLLVFLSTQPKAKAYTLFINDVKLEITTDLIVTDIQNNKYISLKDIEKLMGYTYYNGEFPDITSEDKNKCYLDNGTEIIGFEADSNEIYKTKESSEIEYQYYKLSKNIIKINDKLYIALDDSVIAFNAIYSYSEADLKSILYTADFKTEEYNKKVVEAKTYTSVSTDYNNKKAISYNMIVVENTGKFGVINTNLETIIGTKYASMSFDEYTKDFIVKNSSNKFGLINKDGEGKIDIIYDSLRIINYSPILYEVKQNSKVGVLNQEGQLLINIEYTNLGYLGDKINNINPLLIIPKVRPNENGIIVVKNAMYGIASLKTGEIIVECKADKIYLDEESKKYKIDIERNDI